LAATSGMMYGESSVAGGNEDWSFRGEPGWSEILASFEVSELADDLGLVALSWVGIVGAGHDHCELSLESELQSSNNHANELLVNLFIDWG